MSELVNAEWRDLFEDPEGRLGLRVVGKGGKERVVRIRDDLFSVLSALRGSDALDARDRSPLLALQPGHRVFDQGAPQIGLTGH